MSEKILGKQKDPEGRMRFYVLPIESELGFKDLVKFVSQELGCDFGSLNEGPGTLVQKCTVEGANLVFVLSDSSGAQFYVEEEKDFEIAEKLAKKIEARLREVMR